jgi:hypothetical protein
MPMCAATHASESQRAQSCLFRRKNPLKTASELSAKTQKNSAVWRLRFSGKELLDYTGGSNCN